MCKGKLSADFGEKESKKWPEDPDYSKSWIFSVFQRWTYSYMNSLLHKGAKQTLEDGTNLSQKDLFPVPESMKSNLLSSAFRKYFQEADGSQRRLVATLWKLAAPTFVPAGIWQLVAVVCQVSMPLLVREMLQVLEEHPFQKVIRQGCPYAVGIFLALFLNGIANHRHRHLAMKSGVTMRAATVNVLYEHVLKLTPRGRLGLTSGEVTNLVAVDTQKLFEVAQEGHLIWSLPLSIILVTIFLLIIMGPTTLIGITVLILFVPLVERITSKMLAIRHERAKKTDERIEIINAMLQGIKVTKLNNYEENYKNRVGEARRAELSSLRKELAVWAFTLVVTVTSPMIASCATFTVYVLSSNSNILTASETFTVLLLFSALRFPINYSGRLIGKAAQAVSAVHRITEFMNRETRDIDLLSDKNEEKDYSDHEPPLSLQNAAFLVGIPSTISKDDENGILDNNVSFRVSKFDVTVKKGEIVALVGPVGSGKSTFINGVIGEVPSLPGTIITQNGTISYVPQTPFILNSTLRENILFGLPYDREHYERVLDACCLRPDIEQLGASKDLTEIGERGVTLSGGQKQRISLARAAYSRSDVVLLDDPLSALDSGTSKMVFERLIKTMFSRQAIILVTHAAHFLNHVDQILLIVDGKNEFLGTWNDLLTFKSPEPKTQSAIEHLTSSVQESSSSKFSETVEIWYGDDDASIKKDALMTIEEREHGLSDIKTWLLWFKHAGGIFFMFFQLLFMSIDRFAYVAVEWWLARWTEGAANSITVFGVKFLPQTEGLAAQYKYLAVYCVIIFVSVSATISRSQWAVTGGRRAAKNVFEMMLASVLRAPMSYFETTPMGRLLNRFTFDMEVIDVRLTENMSMFMISCSWYVAGVILMCVILPWVALVIFPVTVMYWMLMLHYRKSGSDLQRLDAVSRSPIQAMVTEGLDGAASIRVFQQENNFLKKFRSVADENSSALLNFVTAQRWLGLRIELLGSFVVLAASLFVVSLNDTLKLAPGLVGLLILWSANFTITLGFMVDTFSEAEAAITAIERVDAMTELPSEKSMETEPENKPPASWPSSGALEFNNVSLRYRIGLPLALNQLSFKIPSGKTCGICGRTGAGKSSITVALFRLVEIEAGHIFLDGVDLGTLGLSDVRGRPNGMTIIPQDPFVAGTTLRECLDPFGTCSDEDILESLQAVRLAKSTDGIDKLDKRVEEGGSNFSVGERQLLNLARALLSKPKVLVLDEATASVDGETDAFIQQMLRTRFKDTTLVTVAHRLGTIVDYDYVLVMDKGHAAEFGSPAELLDMKGVFAELIDATGPEGSKALRAMAYCKAQQTANN